MIPLRTLTAAAALLLAACGKKEEPHAARPPTPPPAAADPSPETPEARPKPRAVSPVRLMTSANGGVQARVAEGWPVVVEAQLLLERGLDKPVTIAGAGAPWSEALTLRCLGPDGTDRAALFRRAFTSSASIEIKPGRSGSSVWVLESVDPDALPPGPHRLRVSVDAAKVGGALPDAQTSNDVILTVLAAGTPETPFLQQSKCLSRMSASNWSGAPAKAIDAADAYLAGHPKDVAVLFMKGNVQKAQGKLVDALLTYEDALRAAEEQKQRGGENFAIMQVINDLRRELDEKK